MLDWQKSSFLTTSFAHYKAQKHLQNFVTKFCSSVVEQIRSSEKSTTSTNVRLDCKAISCLFSLMQEGNWQTDKSFMIGTDSQELYMVSGMMPFN